MSDAYYSENDPIACAVLREAIQDKIIAPGYVDSRSIKDVHVEDLYGFEQHHFFAGAGLWSVACRLAGWPDDRPIWTASCPCQGWSVAGKGLGFNDPRDLWPDLFRLWRAYRPAIGVGEITSGSAILPWLDRTCADLEGEDYACRAVSVPACAVDAPNIRQRLWWSALANPTFAQRSGGISGIISRSPSESTREMAGERWNGHSAPHRDARGFDVADAASDGWQQGVVGATPARYGHIAPSEDGGALAHADSRGRDGRQEDAQRRSIGRNAAERVDADLEHAEGERRREGRPEHEFRGWRPAAARSDASIDLGDASGAGLAERSLATDERRTLRNERAPLGPTVARSWWSDSEWIACADGKARRAKPGIRLLVAGMAGRTDLWRLAGNSINPVLAAEVIKALKDQIDARH